MCFISVLRFKTNSLCIIWIYQIAYWGNKLLRWPFYETNQRPWPYMSGHNTKSCFEAWHTIDTTTYGFCVCMGLYITMTWLPKDHVSETWSPAYTALSRWWVLSEVDFNDELLTTGLECLKQYWKSSPFSLSSNSRPQCKCVFSTYSYCNIQAARPRARVTG